MQDARPRGARLAPRRVAAGLLRRLRRWSRHLRGILPTRLPAWREAVVADPAGDPTRLVVATTADLRRGLADPERDQPVRSLTVVVEDWRRPYPGWSGRLGPLPHLVEHRLVLPSGGRGRAEISLHLTKPMSARSVVAAVLDVLEPRPPALIPASPNLEVVGAWPGWLPPLRGGQRPAPFAGDAGPARDVVLEEQATDEKQVTDEERATDADATAVGTTGRADAPSLGSPALRLVTSAEGTRHREPVVLVDARTANPGGRRRYDDRLPRGVLRLSVGDGGARWWVARGEQDPTPVVAGRVGEPLDAHQRDVLANLSSIACPAEPDAPARSYAAVLAQLAMTGVLLRAPHLPPAVAELLGAELAAILTEPEPTADSLARELASVRQRRAALRRHATGVALPAALAPTYPSLARPPAVTALLLTRRPHLLPQILTDLSRQTYPELEIVVGLHGVEVSAAAQGAIDDFPRPVTVVPLSSSLCFGEALGETTRWARGSLLTKVDDDDRYGPEHIWDLVLAAHYSGATVVGKGAEFVYLAPRDTTVRRLMDSEVYDDYVAGGTIMLSRGDLEAVGGWRPVARSVDRALLDRVLAAGGLVYRTHGFGYLYTRSTSGHTWDMDLDQFDRDAIRRWAGWPPYEEFGQR